MKKITARVTENTDQGMFGVWQLPSGKELAFGTLPWKNNQPDVSSIPYGLYNFKIMKSAKRSKAAGKDIYVYQLFDATQDGIDDTVGRDAVQIHVGNYCGDTSLGWKSDVEGCFILGMGLNRDGVTNQRMVVQSNDAYSMFMNEMGGEPFELDFDAT